MTYQYSKNDQNLSILEWFKVDAQFWNSGDAKLMKGTVFSVFSKGTIFSSFVIFSHKMNNLYPNLSTKVSEEREFDAL